MKITTQDVYLETKESNLLKVSRYDIEKNRWYEETNVEKKENIICLTKEELEKVIGNAFNAGRWYQQKFPNTPDKTEYINTIITNNH